MNYEENYKAALERAQKVLNTPYTEGWDKMKELVEHLFPELAESEDEKTRNYIVDLLKDNAGKIFGDDKYAGYDPEEIGKYQHAIEWLKSLNFKPAVTSDNRIPDGVYYILQDGRHVSTTSPCAVGISAIGIAHDGHYFSVPLDWNYGKSRLLKEDKYPEDEYCQREIEAMMDWDFVKHTNHLKELGLAIELKDGHYLPTMPVFGAMYHNREALNEALNYAGAEEIDFTKCFWFAQKYNVYYAWFFYGNYRSIYHLNVYLALQCGAVSLWKPKV